VKKAMSKRKLQETKVLLSLVACCFLYQHAQGQLAFCAGNSGDPIFMETFGSGLVDGPPLPPGTTTYNYVNGGPEQPVDGNYTISSRTNYFDWFDTTDHTPGDVNGKSLIVNASFTPGEFFRIPVDGLCENTSYEFSSWLMNLHPSTSPGCNFNGIPVNVRFQIWDNTDTNLLASGDTGDIFDKATPIWEQYGLVFQTLPGQTSVILKMINNGAGGCGNDLAIDDIVFRTCGDTIVVTNSSNSTSLAFCEEDTPITTSLEATPDFSVYSSHAYQWQESLDNNIWVDLPGETNNVYATPALNETRFYRVKVAEDAINLANDKCNTVSDTFDIIIENRPEPPTSMGDVDLCANNLGGVWASVPDGVRVDWYDSAINGNLLLENNDFFGTELSGTYYAEAVSEIAGCISTNRTPITITYFDLPVVTDEILELCEGDTITINAEATGLDYLWASGEESFEVMVDAPGLYSVVITDSNNCSITKSIEVVQINNPIIQEVIPNHRSVTVLTENTGFFEYSLDGVTYQENPTFENLSGGNYTAFVRGQNNCPPVEFPFVHIVIPRFFTPNGDNVNDLFKPEGVDSSQKFRIEIYDRFSKLMFQSNDPNFQWNGLYNGKALPASDYWYYMEVGESPFKGHFALIR
jgi:gliding motility-associated-like protein